MTVVVTTKRGDTWLATFAFVVSGTEADLTGCTAKMQVRTKTDTLVLTATTDALTDPPTAGLLTVDGAAGTVTLLMPKAITTPVVPGSYVADIELTYADGTVRSSDTFSVKIGKDITLHD